MKLKEVEEGVAMNLVSDNEFISYYITVNNPSAYDVCKKIVEEHPNKSIGWYVNVFSDINIEFTLERTDVHAQTLRLEAGLMKIVNKVDI